MSRDYNHLPRNHLKIEKIRELIVRKYFWLILTKDIEAYIKECDIYFGFKIVKPKPYKDL